MKAIALMYHDVVEGPSEEEASGFAGGDAAVYKVERVEFDAHLRAIAERAGKEPVSVFQLGERALHMPLMITIDDGGRSGFTHSAPALERYGWRGHFFVPSDYIGKGAFMSGEEIRALRARGHVIGSHSASHPARMARLSWEQMLREWRASIERLSDVLGQAVRVASVPGGHFSRQVAEAAAQAGIECLFTSEPTTRVYQVGPCTILGRYTMKRRTPAAVVAAIARGEVGPRWRQLLVWNAKKATKAMGGEYYLRARGAWLRRRRKDSDNPRSGT